MAHGESPRHQPRKRPKKPSKAPSPSSASPAGGQEKGVEPEGSIRLQKLLASAGFGSRREVERFLAEERVTVNGRVAKLGDRADPLADEIRFDGERLLKERPVYWIVNKPRGVVTTVRDEEGRRKIVDLLPRGVGRLFPVGRLDRETTGLVLMTNDGDAAHVLLHPSLGNEREYRVSVKGNLDSRGITRLERGVTLEEGRTSPARVTDVRFDADSGTSSLTLTLCEGKKRQIRRSLLVLGFPVRRLVRVRMGPLKIGRLAVGEARALRTEEKRALLEHVRRLRAGEAPVVPSTRDAGPKRSAAPRKASATRKAQGSRKAKGGAAWKPADKRKSRPARGAKSVDGDGSPNARARRTGEPPSGPAGKTGKRAEARPGTKTGNRNGSKPGKHPRASSKPVARNPAESRKPAGRKGQRTATSRKGVRK